jgi:uncharacterized protein (TIGR02266 family)
MSEKTILLVDDTELFLQLERTFLQRSNINILTASNGKQALDLARKHFPDVVFLDLNMPIMDGEECCRAMKNDPDLKGIPIVMVTTDGRPQDQERCRDAGCDEILLKPINRTEFVATAQKLLQLPVREERFKATIQIQYGQKADKILNDFSIDISSGGLFIKTDTLLDVDEMLQVGFVLPSPVREVNCSAQVVWVNQHLNPKKSALPSGFGIRFIDLSLDDLHAIRNYIQNNQKEPS